MYEHLSFFVGRNSLFNVFGDKKKSIDICFFIIYIIHFFYLEHTLLLLWIYNFIFIMSSSSTFCSSFWWSTKVHFPYDFVRFEFKMLGQFKSGYKLEYFMEKNRKEGVHQNIYIFVTIIQTVTFLTFLKRCVTQTHFFMFKYSGFFFQSCQSNWSLTRGVFQRY